MTDHGDNRHTKGQPGITQAALFGLCPRCGAKGLWAAPAQFSPACPACGLDFEAHEMQGRSAYLVVLPVTVLLIFAALKLDEVVRLPAWALVLLWPPLVAASVIGAMRLAKVAVLMARIGQED
ncbi:MAG: hypothetical protein RIS94_2639 [Pseudomonadota bacterium]|jgi:uncharacterized protein (DUF983 family)